ncbi:phosphoglucosamine mutase [Kingella kingae]|uniref:phosphoglucosamine mutase n=1 Tax=Kingella kingae TaxID=504 RepID=UPI0004090218|nr:phosphoglucosamine mutase [Kingella kingae]MDK4565019.1 phosphoglucosamine mutase [Kingella kingae]MDK4577712.1 phosphoglucosamine mutase [Kingella kingae]MDK4607780.1 phosphoglucosamine mutase [Kingella kingae]MDK4625916.1 phosphoglucosamine mutase [Kingella kingae]MDK4673492.1 phosphoglucosamine mutase [Kingella kingae]
MARKYFGTDGIRGEVGQFPITPDFVIKLGCAFGRALAHKEQEHRPTVIIGKDTRISGYMLETALVAGFTAAGVNVVQTGPLPTPGIAYLTRALRLDGGVMISASHNEFSDNGIKFFAEGGVKLSDEMELAIEAELDKEMHTLPSIELGRARRISGADDRYIEFCKSTFPNTMNLRSLRLVVDTANGAGYHTAPKVFHELGAEVISIGAEPNGYNINDKIGATYPKTLQAAVLQHDADYGIALDGDGDRLMMVDKNSVVYDGDKLIYVIAKARAQQGLPFGGVVGTVMSNLAMEKALNACGIEFARAKVGDRYVLEQLKQRDWLIGGEASGHILCMDKHNTGDGTISALQVLAALKVLEQDLASAIDWQPYPQTMINVRIQKDQDWKSASQAALAEVEAELGERGRVVLRASGTEPVVRVMVEADSASLAEQGAKRIADAITAV